MTLRLLTLGITKPIFFGTVNGTPVKIDLGGPAFESSWGAGPNVQLHAILLLGVVLSSNSPMNLYGGTASGGFGVTDMEPGAKFGFVEQTKHCPQTGSFAMFEIPTRSSTGDWGLAKNGKSCPHLGRIGGD
jgi:hypothetical protein